MELIDCLNLREEILSLKYEITSFVEHFFVVVDNKIIKQLCLEDKKNIIKPECVSGNQVN